MGWKTIKERFRIEHIVSVEDDLINIGSPYVRDLIALRVHQGTVVEIRSRSLSGNKDLVRYRHEFEIDPANLDDALNTPDRFERSLPVYVAEVDSDGKIVSELCEEYGYPNCTHSGRLMYSNTFFKEEKDALFFYLNEQSCWYHTNVRRIEMLHQNLHDQQLKQNGIIDELAKVVSNYGHLIGLSRVESVRAEGINSKRYM